MIYQYVAVESKEVDGEWKQTIIADGKIIAHDSDRARLEIGALLGKKLTKDVEVTIRPF